MANSAKYTYVTILSDGYWKGCWLSISQSRNAASIHCWYYATIPQTTQDILQKNGVQYRVVDMITSPLESAKYRGVYTKLMLFNLLEYDLVAFMDSDTLILRSPDDIFEKDAEWRTTQAIEPRHCTEWSWRKVNSRLVLWWWNHPLNYSPIWWQKKTTPNYDGGDQGFLTHIFQQLYRIPDEYHVTKRIFKHHPAKWNEMMGRIRILHYPGVKPWDTSERIPFEKVTNNWKRCGRKHMIKLNTNVMGNKIKYSIVMAYYNRNHCCLILYIPLPNLLK